MVKVASNLGSSNHDSHVLLDDHCQPLWGHLEQECSSPTTCNGGCTVRSAKHSLTAPELSSEESAVKLAKDIRCRMMGVVVSLSNSSQQKDSRGLESVWSTPQELNTSEQLWHP